MSASTAESIDAPLLENDGDAQLAPSQPTYALASKEARTQAGITVPLALTLLTRFVQGFVDVAVVGRLIGADALAGASLALTIQFTTIGIVTAGFGDAVANLCAESLGAGEPHLCGVWLQLGMLCSTVAAVALIPVWWYAGALLGLMGVSDQVTSYATSYARTSLPRGLVHVNYYCFKVYLASQGRLVPDVTGCVVGLVTSVLLDVVLVGGTCALIGSSAGTSQCWSGLGFVGAPIAAVAARCLTTALVVTLARFSAFGVKSAAPWHGWMLHSRPDGALRKDRLRAFLAVALPAAVRSAVDQGQILSLSLMAATMGSAEAGAHNACIELYACIGGAVAWANCDTVLIRVAKELGAGRGARARLAAVVGFAVVALYAAIVPPAVLLPVAGSIGSLFSNDPAVLRITADTLPAMCCLIAATAVVFAVLGASIGAGRASTGGRVWLAGALLIVPLAYGWGVAAGGGVPALWAACAVGYAGAASVLGILLVRADWDALARDSVERQQNAAANGSSTAVADRRSPAESDVE